MLLRNTIDLSIWYDDHSKKTTDGQVRKKTSAKYATVGMLLA